MNDLDRFIIDHNIHKKYNYRIRVKLSLIEQSQIQIYIPFYSLFKKTFFSLLFHVSFKKIAYFNIILV